MDQIMKRISNLLSVKSIVTLAATAVFSCLALRESISSDQFMTVFSVIVAFYFGTQLERKAGVTDGNSQ